jgi:uncharacterized protein YlzI (FlbEa/FlbD family)
MKTITFTTQSGQNVTILTSTVIGMRRMNDETFGPRTAIDTSTGAAYVVTESDEEYVARVEAWKLSLRMPS